MLRPALITALAAAAIAALAFATGSMIGVSVPTRAGAAPVTLAKTGRAAPELTGLTKWFNSAPLKLADLRGKVVLVDFWTYGCINCVRTLPPVVDLYKTYKDKGFVVIGVHAPEFPHERSAANVAAALKRHGIEYPVAQDNKFATWNAYKNQYWPAQYIVDRDGTIVYEHAGEGQYDRMRQLVGKLLEKTS